MTCRQGRSLRFPVALALISLSAGLSGCGGGSGSDEPSPNPAPPAPTPTLNTFSTQIIYRDECSEAQPHPYAEVFLHDDAGNVVDRQTVDAEGRVSFSREEAFMPVTVVTLRRPSSENNNYATFEYFDRLPMTELGRINGIVDSEFQQAGTCSCASGTLTIEAPPEAPDSAFRYSFSDRVTRGDNNVTVCETNSAWPYHYATFERFDSETSYALLLNNFDTLRDTGEQLAFADFQSVSEPVPSHFSRYSSYVRIDGHPLPVLFSSTSDGNDIKIYPNHHFVDQSLYRSAGFDFLSDEFGTVVFKRIYSLNPSEFASLENDVQIPDLASLDISALGETGEFDFSPVSNMPFLWIDMTLSSSSHTVEYRYNGLTRGRVTDTAVYTGYEEYLADLDVNRVSLQFFNYDNLEPSASALGAAIFSSDENPINTQNYQNHYRRAYQYVSFDLNPFDFSPQMTAPRQVLSSSSKKLVSASHLRAQPKQTSQTDKFREKERGF